MQDKTFENFLNEQKEQFCSFRCPYRNKIKVQIYVNNSGTVTCDNCGDEIDVDVDYYYDADILICDNCPLDDFIKEIRDSANISVSP